MSQAQSRLAYYESEDFINNYAEHLLEDSHACINRIHDLFRRHVEQSEDTKGVTPTNIYNRRDISTMLYEWLAEGNVAFDELQTYCNSYGHVGHHCIDSIAFGEQEEQINVSEIKDFEDNDFTVNDHVGRDGITYAYYDLTNSGVYIDFKYIDWDAFNEHLEEHYEEPVDDIEELTDSFIEEIDIDKDVLTAIIDLFSVTRNELMKLDVRDNELEIDGEEYMYGTDDEMDVVWDERVENIFDECVLPLVPVNLHCYIDYEKWKSDAEFDGRAHTLATYDGNEQESNGIYFYRTN